MKKNDLKKSVESMTGAGLVEYYNYLAATLQLPAVKRFSTRQAGITRTKSLVDQAEALIAAEEKKAAETVDGRKNPNGPVATCRFIFDKLHGLDYTRIQFMKDCLEAGVPKSTSGKLWIPFGGARKGAK